MKGWVTGAAKAIQGQAGPALRSRIGERLVVEEDFDPVRSICPDARVFERGGAGHRLEVDATSAPGDGG